MTLRFMVSGFKWTYVCCKQILLSCYKETKIVIGQQHVSYDLTKTYVDVFKHIWESKYEIRHVAQRYNKVYHFLALIVKPNISNNNNNNSRLTMGFKHSLLLRKYRLILSLYFGQTL